MAHRLLVIRMAGRRGRRPDRMAPWTEMPGMM
jgi:hypothetical protein